MIIFDPAILPLYVMAYLLGSIPTAVWTGKLFYGIDVREHGSHNAGATNTYRVLGGKAAVPVLLVDILKGFTATSLIHLYPELLERDTSSFVLVKIFCGSLAILGHLFPLFAGFRGGKGVATMFGMIIGLHPAAAGISFLIFLLTYGVWSYVSLGSILASFAFILAVVLVFKDDRTALVVFALLQFGLILFTHRKNIERLKSGNEKTIRIFSSKRSL
ncbi:MAG: glycerol-3-phosphate 1-O-acyltransferase PlsY [Sphingobacteriaceae bacterium]|nr:glycerol-3-phosphate 1-O-acyltransferase PlsY [Sphingobacteriaceae bacterium]